MERQQKKSTHIRHGICLPKIVKALSARKFRGQNHPSFQSIRLIPVWTTAWFLFLILVMSLRADQFDTLRLTWQTNLINSGGSALSIANTANNYWSSMDTSDSRTYLWSDLPFGSVSANLVSTFSRLQAMALAWAKPGSSLQGNASLASAIASGLDWMNTHVYTTNAIEYNNWFHWEISGPQALNNTMVLLYPALTGGQITNYLSAIDRFSPGGAGAKYGWMTGANTSDKVLVVAIRGILGKDADKLTSAQSNLSPVFLYVTSGDGFYTDGSFVFHSNIAYNGHYGLVLLGDIPKLVNLLQGSAWQITDPNLTNVYDWVFNSFEPLIYNGAMMDMVRGRAVSWSYETESGDGSSALSAMRQIAQFAPTSTAAALTNFANSPRLAAGQFHFASMDRVLALRTNFGFGISMSSSRIAGYESINSGNLHGWHQGDGMTYLYIGNKDDEFNGDFWPTVDPYHLPGTTAEINALSNSFGEAKTTDQNWVGGAQVANACGVAGMSLHPYQTTLSGKKSWFMFDNEIVCLGAGITCDDTGEVHTTAENRRLGSPITNSFTLNGTAITPIVGWSSNLPSATASWCALGGTGGYYFPAGNSNLQATFLATSGSWSQINSGDSGTVYTDNYLKLWFNHGQQPANASYAYVILPNLTASSVSNYALNPDIIILTNTASIQAVKKPALGVVAANFWTNGNSSADLISVNNKSSVISWETTTNISVGISDPTQTNKNSITVTLNRPASSVLSADAGVTVLQLTPQIIFSVNVNGSRGRTFQAAFQLGSPMVAIVVPTTNTVYLNSTNQTLLLAATANNPLPATTMTTVWSQADGPGTVTFGDPNALTTTANFSADGIYNLTFTANNGSTNSAGLMVVVNSSIGAVTNGLLGWWKMDETGGTTAFDSSGNGANASVHGGTFTSGRLFNALHLTGGTNNAAFNSVDALQTTVTAWVRADSNGGSSFPRILVMPGCYFNFRFDGSANNNTLDFATTTAANGSTVDGEWLSPTNSIGTGTWYHVAVSYDKSSTANVPALYVNGVRVSLTTLTTPSVSPPSNVGTTYIGNRLDLTRGWDGLIDDLRIYNRLLNDAEVQSLAATPPNFAPTVNAGTNQTVVWPAAANLIGTVADDGNPSGTVTVAWSEVSGPGTVAFANSNAMATTASFSAAGSYQLQLAADDGQVTTVGGVMVAVLERPNLSFQLLPGSLQLSWPASNGNWQLQYQTNSLGTNWQNLPGPINNPFVVPIDHDAGSVFYRLLLTGD
jgi:hyaluronate lyase